MRWLFRILRWSRDVKAIERGRVPQRLWNRSVSVGLRAIGRKLYR